VIGLLTAPIIHSPLASYLAHKFIIVILYDNTPSDSMYKVNELDSVSDLKRACVLVSNLVHGSKSKYKKTNVQKKVGLCAQNTITILVSSTNHIIGATYTTIY
jgi:hypothetical protein